MRIVGRRDQIVIAERFDDVGDEFLVTLDGAEPLPPEVLGGRHDQMGHLAVGRAPLVVLVHSLEPERQPPALPLEEREAKSRESLQHTAHDDVHAGQHLLHRVRRDVRDPEALEAIRPRRLHARAGRFMEPHRHVQLLTGSPERVIIAVVPRPLVVDIRTEEDRLHSELDHGAARLHLRALHVVRRHGGGAE